MTDTPDISLVPGSSNAGTPILVKRGFAAMDRGRQRDIASKGGSSVPVSKRSFSRDHELAVRAGRKGGLARMRAAQASRDGESASTQ